MFEKRPSLSKEERRAEHNALERARRVSLNGKFRQLAEALPNLQNHRRPSKGQIVEKALDWVKQSVSKEDRYQHQILQLQRENKRLLVQLSFAQEMDSTATPTTPPPPPLATEPVQAQSTQWLPPASASSCCAAGPCAPWSVSSSSSFDMHNAEGEDDDEDPWALENPYPPSIYHRASISSLGSFGQSYDPATSGQSSSTLLLKSFAPNDCK
ncbi:hypothetical protein EC973_009566 [Apophysomyces ossiformis]|uniref:BHLH domain-containing protein n=1 Tax=Apophysomyces ossiformis TaxID=679940 RepID=A0A8H7ENC8_9FUNG|nr:hypothetical protein EC973_009566 [Apophysomyces ossiformis]